MRPITSVPPRERGTQSSLFDGNSINILISTHLSGTGKNTHVDKFTGRPIPDKSIVRVFVPEAQAHLGSADRDVKEGNAGAWVIDNGNRRLWVLLPSR